MPPFGPIRVVKLAPGDVVEITAAAEPVETQGLVMDGSDAENDSNGLASGEFQNGRWIRSGHSLALGGPRHY